MVFVNSMSDLFHELIPDDYIARVFHVMSATPQHTFQVLTKRPVRMREWAKRHRPDPLPNVWLGTSIENIKWVGRADVLREVPATVRFISAEPLLGPLYNDDSKIYRWLNLDKIDWLIVGGESGVGARPVDARWIRDLRDEALNANTAFFFKQWGGRTPKSNGRLLDGREWSEYPETQVAA
jgi:protein gp37